MIFANGKLVDHERVSAAARQAELLIAADGGARHCLALGFNPNVVIGDMDSLTESEREQLKAAGTDLIRLPAEKDQTDLELALHFALEQPAARITVVGSIGGRLDMTLANLMLLADERLKSVELELWHGNQTAWILRPPGGSIRGVLGDTLSLIPLGQAATGITTHDLEYPLLDEPLEIGPARGLSNRISGPQPRIELKTGLLLVVHTPGKA